MQRLGVIPVQLAGSDIYAALADGSIDAAEWVGPYDDERLGLYKAAKHYYYPGWWEGGPEIDLFVNAKAWAELPKAYQAILEAACAEANVDMVAKYDARNPAALRRLVAAGVQLHQFPREIMQASYKAAVEVYDEFAASNAKFRRSTSRGGSSATRKSCGFASPRKPLTSSWSSPASRARRQRRRRSRRLASLPPRHGDQACAGGPRLAAMVKYSFYFRAAPCPIVY